MTRNRIVPLVSAVFVAIACSESKQPTNPNPNPPPAPPPPVNSVVVSLTSPNNDDGAVVVTLQGPSVSTLQRSSSGYLLYSRSPGAQETRVIVVGSLATGPLFTFAPAAGANLSAYSATVQQVANRADALRASTTGYTLTIAAAP